MKGFTLIELIFVIVIIGILAAVAVPRFLTSEMAASKTKLKETVSSVNTAIENIHGKWIIDDNYVWQSKCEFDSSTGYPKNLEPDGSKFLFSCVLKKGVLACNSKYDDSSKYTHCFYSPQKNVYYYYFTPQHYVKLEYNKTNGTLECANSSSYTKEQCENMLY